MKLDLCYIRAIQRNFNEIANALQRWQALVVFDEYIRLNGKVTYQGISFFELSYHSLFNDVISHMIKVLDLNKDSATFWYIKKNQQIELGSLKSYTKEKISFLESLAKKLKQIRDKTHFHIDLQGVFDHKQIWDDAGISGKELGAGVEYLFDMLFELRNLIFNENMSKIQYSYHGDDLKTLLSLANEKGLISLLKTE